jgi:hypothetical protein
MFLDDEELYILTGYRWHSKQVAELRRQGVPFRVNAAGRPAVARSAIEGGKQPTQPKTWEPSWAANLR